MTKRATVAFAVLLAVAVPHAQQSDRARALDAQIGRIFEAREYEVPRFGPARWLPDGMSYTTVERGSDHGSASAIVRYDAKSGARSVLVPAAQLTPKGRTAPLEIADYLWSRDGRRLLVFTNTRKVWRQNTRGDYWVLDLGSGMLRQLGGGAPEASLMFAKFSPDGSRAAYVRANNLYVERIDDGRVVQLTTDGSDTTINGTSDWVYEEELNLQDGFRWSPDGTKIAFWQFDTTGIGTFSLINDTDALYPVVTRIPYPKAGTKNSAVRIGVVSADDRHATRWLDTPGDPRDTYLARMDWLDADTMAIQQLNRLQNRNDLLLADAGSGEVRRVFRDESKTWVEVMDDLRWIDRGRACLWRSERDGWRHAYRVPRDGGDPLLLTKFDADVIDIAGVDEAGGWLYFIATPDRPTDRYLYRSRLDGSGVPERVTPAVDRGTHGYDIAPGGLLAFHTWSTFDRPPSTGVVDLPDHRALRPLTDISTLMTRLEPIVVPPVEFFALDIGGGVTLDGWMLKPKDFDPARTYPVIAYVYGEPAGVTVTDRWGGGRNLFHRALAEAGYIVVSVDNRGTPAPKGAAWRKVIYGTVGDLSSKEQAAAMRALAARYRFIDGARVGIWGWSGGGSNTLNAMFRFPETFKVGVSVAPVPDQKLYDTIYQERYMGLPGENAEGYRVGSPINFAEGLQGKLLVVHGSGDDNVHYQGTERLVNRLIALGKPFDMMVYPNRTHAIAEGPGTTAHIYRLIGRYLLEHLPPQP
ncbi:MAG TPA: S9 family peptidase [Vicinamibacterales bacterium]|nr:S9 family peptidase [Vicinamibacterales bacterium]